MIHSIQPCPLLHEHLFRVEASHDSKAAVVWPTGMLTHAQLRQSARRVAGRLGKSAIGRGNRVIVCLPKCAEAVQAIMGILASGAAYVPVDFSLPAARLKKVVADARASLMITAPMVEKKLREAGPADGIAPLVVVSETGTGHGLAPWTAGSPAADPAPVELDDTAAMLYTSGSSGEPKAVMLSHRNIGSFVQWAVHKFGLQPDDRFSSHAPFHFDLSTIDLFASLNVGASVFLVSEKMAIFPAAVVRAVAEHRCTIWYSVPTALQLMLDHGGLGRLPLPSLRTVLFAGEAFPAAALRRLMLTLPSPRYVNLYGPTETNVCTYHILPDPPDERQKTIPIGLPCEHLEVRLLDDDRQPVTLGQTGEICVFGLAVMQGYWRKEELTRSVRFQGRQDSYRTGDLGSIEEDGLIHFRGRRDQQIKIRGHRVELLEIEGVVTTHPQIARAAVVWSCPQDLDGKLIAFVVPTSGQNPASMALRRYCATELPAHAVPASFVIVERLPTTSRGKIDRAGLAELARATFGATDS